MSRSKTKMDVRKMLIDAGATDLSSSHKAKPVSTNSHDVSVTLQCAEITEPNTFQFSFKRMVLKTGEKKQFYIRDYRKWVAKCALIAMKNSLPTARVALSKRAMGKDLAKTMHATGDLILCKALASSPGDRSIYSLESLGDTENEVIHQVQIQIDAGDKDKPESIVTDKHDARCAKWIQKAEAEILETVMQNPAEYKFDERTNEFVHRKCEHTKLQTYTHIETPLVNKERYVVCIDGFIALRARQAVAKAEAEAAACNGA